MEKKVSLFTVSLSFIRGLATVLDIGATLGHVNNDDKPEKVDFNAIYSDWEAVGLDIKNAMEQWEHEYIK